MRYPIIILHGWKKSGGDYSAIQKAFEDEGYLVFAPDMPGFGNEPLTKKRMTIDDYIQFVINFLETKKIKKAIFIGHSFGGRVAAKFAAKYPEKVVELILTGAPLIKQPISVRKQLFSLLAKGGKITVGLIPGMNTFARKVLYRSIGEWDYYKAGQLRDTIQEVLAEDIAPNLPSIPSRTLVIWGSNDTFVLSKVGKEIAERIPHAIYKEIPLATHKLPYEQPSVFADEVLKFLTSK